MGLYYKIQTFRYASDILYLRGTSEEGYSTYTSGAFVNTWYQYIDIEEQCTLPSNCVSMFEGITVDKETADWSLLDTSQVTDMSEMFYQSNFTTLDLSSWNTSNVTKMFSMFDGCEKLTTLDISTWDVSKVTSMYSMFKDCKELSYLNLSNWKTDSLKYVFYMFYNCDSLTEISVDNFNLSNVTELTDMFYGCDNLSTINGINNWDVSGITGFDSLFSNCAALRSLDLSNWDIASATSMQSMFCNCKNLLELDLSGMSLNANTAVSNIFNGDTELCSIYASDWAYERSSSGVGTTHLFDDCTSLPNFDSSITDITAAHNCKDEKTPAGYFNGEFSRKMKYGTIELNDNNYIVKANNANSKYVYTSGHCFWKG